MKADAEIMPDSYPSFYEVKGQVVRIIATIRTGHMKVPQGLLGIIHRKINVNRWVIFVPWGNNFKAICIRPDGAANLSRANVSK